MTWRRGHWLVAGQFALFALVAFGPRHWPGAAPWPAALAPVARALGVVLVIAGVALALTAIRRFGRHVTPLPYPVEGVSLIETGVYRLVRHPMYSGAIHAAVGWALVTRGELTLAWAALLAIYLDGKARWEENRLCERYPGYDAYRRRVRRFIPFVY